jgi:hypothetical protein
MITNYKGTSILGSSALQTSVANQEIIPANKSLVNFELVNDQICTISINGGTAIYIRANQGILIDVIKSCKIVEAGITFNWIGVEG